MVHGLPNKDKNIEELRQEELDELQDFRINITKNMNRVRISLWNIEGRKYMVKFINKIKYKIMIQNLRIIYFTYNVKYLNLVICTALYIIHGKDNL